MTDEGAESCSPLPVRVVRDVGALKALSDPLRLAIMQALMNGAARVPRVLSVKELAAELGQPQTRLYHHVKQLEAHELITVAESRVVSGITEHRYRAGQFELRLDPALVNDPRNADDTVAALRSSFDEFTAGFFAALQAGRIRYADEPSPEARHPRQITVVADQMLPVSRAADFRDRLGVLVEDFLKPTGEVDEPTVPVHVMMVFYSPTDSSSDDDQVTGEGA